ncbi:MAG: ATP-dependent DNA helicase [Xanthomonadales bacterium]|nr:ATP-dependent DNA helicase [Gammaproteobacteria bacterium]NNK04721.1 ATP-dependent DNA helicase [Xanthomonadales bacterium]
MSTSKGGSAQLLDSGGPFESVLTGFAPRQEQLQLAEAIEKTVAIGGTLVAEAGTGIGKTLSYLVPVLEGRQRTIISTGTKTLQDQLYFRDLPMVKKALKSTLKTALLKGRGNYLCLYRMDQARKDGRLPSRDSVAELEAIRQWVPSTVDGDLSISSVMTEDSELWPFVTSTAENCLGSDCPDFEACFVARARREAQDADVVVVNHHLLFADMAIKHGGFGEVLPGASVFIVDEAHQAPETASQFFSSSLSVRQISDLCRDVLAEAAETSGGMASVRDGVAHCRQVIKEFQLACHDSLEDRGTWDEMLGSPAVVNALQSLDAAVAALGPVVGALQGASRGMDACLQRLAEIQAQFDHLDKPAPDSEVRWFERRGRGVAIHTTPLDISSLFSGFCEQLDAAWVFTSATLSVNGGFDHFVRQLGLQDADTLNLDSPFDYENNALMWLPKDLPEPREYAFVPALLEQVRPVLEASKGRAFMLFTSHRALKQAAELLSDTIDHPLFVQGEMPRSMLLEAFRNSGDGILLGSASFWGGVDVMGEALSLVIIDKLPFAPPNDPVMVARSNQLRQHGGNPFMELFLPQAVIALKQGAGRLIRDVNDRGVLVICDRRLNTKGYGSVFLESLPPMRQTLDRDQVLEFFKDETTGD